MFCQSCLFLRAMQYFVPPTKPSTACISLSSEISVTDHLPSCPVCSHIWLQSTFNTGTRDTSTAANLSHCCFYLKLSLIHSHLSCTCCWTSPSASNAFSLVWQYSQFSIVIKPVQLELQVYMLLGIQLLFNSFSFSCLWLCKMKRVICFCFREEKCCKRTRLVCHYYPGLTPIILTALCFGEIVSVCISG